MSSSSEQPSDRALVGQDAGDSVGKWPASRPSALAAELRWVHDMIRKDLVTVLEFASRVASTTLADEFAGDLDVLQTSGPLFRLRANCLTMCQILDSHHNGEDMALFPAVRQAAPHLAATVDRLDEDHRRVAALIEDVQDRASDLGDSTARAALVDSLHALSATLLDHLDFEERELQPVLESWGSWPGQR